MIDNVDPVYPIYEVTLQWNEDGLPEGMSNNLAQGQIMKKEPVAIEELEKEVAQRWEKDNKNHVKNRRNLQVEVKFLRHESWCLNWFGHQTFDVGQTDEEVLASFERFVARNEWRQRLSTSDENYMCLMGAEDRWRWSGFDNDGNRIDPPCRCDGCRENGLIRIVH